MKDYLTLLTSLNVSSKEGRPAPHKPILLLTIINFIEAGVIDDGKVYLTSELELAFKNNWNRLVGDDSFFNCNIALPFYHMGSEPFWKLIKSSIYEERQSYNLSALKESFEYAQLDREFADQLKDKQYRAKCRVLLISYYLLRTHGFNAVAKKEQAKTEIVEGVYYSHYSDHSFVIGGETKPYKDFLKSLGGFFNYSAFSGKPGWIFPLRKREEIISAIKAGNTSSHTTNPTSKHSKATKSRKKKTNSIHDAAVEWKENSAGYQWAIEQLRVGMGRSLIVSGFNRKKDAGVPGFETRRGGYLTAAILSQWSKDIEED